MDYDDATLSVYNQNANDYAARQAPWYFQEDQRQLFIKKLKPEGKILDLGCGPGNDAIKFQEKGFQVLALDGSSAMTKMASDKGLNTRT